MAIDDLLRESLRGEPTALADPDGWDDVRARGASIRRRRSIGRGATAVVTAAALVVGVLLVVDRDDTRREVATAPSSSDIVAALDDGRVVVLDSDDGRVLRTLFTSSGGEGWANGLSAAPDGSIYLGLHTPPQPPTCASADPPQIVHIDGSGNWLGEGIVGMQPLVSPDGRYVAYAGSDAPADACGPFTNLVVRDVKTGTEHRIEGDGKASFIAPRAWSSDSRKLAYYTEALPDITLREVDVSAGGLNAPDRTTEVLGNGFSYLPDGSLISAYPGAGSHIAVVDRETGQAGRVVTDTEAPSAFLNATDPTGTRFLLTGPLGDFPDGWNLYEAHAGDPHLNKLAEHVRWATWLPAQRATPTPTPGASTEVVAVVGHNTEGDRLVVLSAEDGHEIRTLAEGIGITLGGIAATPDGNTAYFARLRQGLPCSVIEIARVPLAGGAVETVVSPGSHPVVSPDGRTLAYARSSPPDACASGGTIALRDLASGQEREINLGPIVQPWSWSPDGTQIAVGTREGEQFSAVTTFGIADLRPTAFLDLPSAAAAATYLPDGRLVVAFLDDATGGHRLLTYDAAGAVTGTLFETSTSG
ncbi:MAG: hypothetical protein WEC34_15085, partial [Acidimicrobiia bacterium]